MRNIQSCQLFAPLYKDIPCSYPSAKKCGLRWYIIFYENNGRTWEKAVRLCKYRVRELGGIEPCLAEKIAIEKELKK